MKTEKRTNLYRLNSKNAGRFSIAPAQSWCFDRFRSWHYPAGGEGCSAGLARDGGRDNVLAGCGRPGGIENLDGSERGCTIAGDSTRSPSVHIQDRGFTAKGSSIGFIGLER